MTEMGAMDVIATVESSMMEIGSRRKRHGGHGHGQGAGKQEYRR